MAQTTLLVRLLHRSQATLLYPTIFRIVAVSLLLISGAIFTGCGSGEDGGVLSLRAGSSGDGSSGLSGAASASLTWDPVSGVLGYFIHYGTQSPGSPGSCAYAQSAFSSTPTATLTGLAANTTYYFAVSSYNGLESACSMEVVTVTASI